jgi:biopolymer transport protein ExbB
MFHTFIAFMNKGGPVMWLLLVMSVVTLTLIVERTWFWVRTNGAAQRRRVLRLEQSLRQGDTAAARALVQDDQTVYGDVVRMILAEGYSDALATAAVESQRPRFDKYMGVLSTMITAGPLVGLLGSVIGLISVFLLFSKETASANPASVGEGMAEALMNTAGGLIVAVVAIFPYNAFRVQIDRTLGRIEAILAAASRHAARPSAEQGKSGPPMNANERE